MQAPQPTPSAVRKAEEDVYHTLHTMLWHLACDIGRSPPEKAPGLVAKARSDIMGVTGQTRLAADKCPSEWSKDDIGKFNVKCALASLEEAIKQRDNLSAELASNKELLASRNADVDLAHEERDKALATVVRLERSHCVIMNERNDQRHACALAEAALTQSKIAWAHVVDERDKAHRELEVAYSDRNAYHVALDKIVKLAGEIRNVADGSSTK